MRGITEKLEGVNAGTILLMGTKEETIYSTFKKLLKEPDEYRKMACACNPNGDRHACEQIANILERKEYKP